MSIYFILIDSDNHGARQSSPAMAVVLSLWMDDTGHSPASRDVAVRVTGMARAKPSRYGTGNMRSRSAKTTATAVTSADYFHRYYRLSNYPIFTQSS